MRRFAAALLATLVLAACSHHGEPAVLTLVYNHYGFVMEPAPPNSPPPQWSQAEALTAITKGDPDGDKTRAWFGYYQGHPAWLAITDGAHLAIPGPAGASTPTRGHRIAVFPDGVTPANEITEVDGAGTAARPNVAPPRPRKYDGRMHITYITPGAAQVAATPTKWMFEPAPRAVHPKQPLDAAINRSQAVGVNQVDATARRVYFGLFTGRDVTGALRAKAPAWLVVGSLPHGRYAVTAFTDDLTEPWVSGRIGLAARPLAY